jgi:hypothetical protein
VLSWNDLQESFAELFWTLMNPPAVAGDSVNYNPIFAWAAINSDRAQRGMLEAVIKRSRTNWGRLTMREDLEWLVKEANALEDQRNDAIHSPLFYVDPSLYGATSTSGKVAPAPWLFNRRASKLIERADLLREFRYCRDAAIVLADYAQQLNTALTNRGAPWPSKPPLPSRPPKATPRSQRGSP